MDEVKKILITGAKGFIGRNLLVALKCLPDLEIFTIDQDDPPDVLSSYLEQADVIYHLAGINRPQNEDEFQLGNADLTRNICSTLEKLQRNPKIVFTSSIQAELSNPYGVSKRKAEEALADYAKDAKAEVAIYRLRNVFGKWCRPNYNSVTATFCHNVSHGLPLQISDPSRELELVYIDDVVASLLSELTPSPEKELYREIPRYSKITLGALAETISSFPSIRSELLLPNLEDRFVQELYVTYLSYLEPEDFAYDLNVRTDERGILAEFLKSRSFGQIFVSRTKPGITRGNHYHHTKTEKFLVLEGDAIIRFRNVSGDESVIEHRVSGASPRVVDIPPGYTHSIENVGSSELVTLFWASEIFDPARADTVFEAVI